MRGAPIKKLFTPGTCVYINTAVMVLLALYFFLIPAGLLIYDLNDPGSASDKMPRCVLRWHKSLSPKYETWAKSRLAAGVAPGLHDAGVSGTEWPVFGSVFYLWATEALQEAVDGDPSLSFRQPKDYARGAIQAATALVVDPNQATWIKDYWGDDYLHEKNLFYRMMLISAMTSYEKLIGDNEYTEFLRIQVESLAHELDTSPYGLVEDYPGYTYPIDIVAAIAAIQRADTVLGTDHSEFVKRAVRGFQGSRLHEDTGLPGYLAHAQKGHALDCARGIGLSFMLIWAPELWPETARDWYQKYERHFWQEDTWFAGFREYSRDIKVNWFHMDDPDAGPVFKGYGTAACAFGIAASRAQGRYDHTRALAAQALVASWPLPDGSLLGPRLLSHFSEAPYLGEATTLFIFAHRSRVLAVSTASAGLPRSVYLALFVYISIGVYELGSALYALRRWYRLQTTQSISAPHRQVGIWCILMACALVTCYAVHPIVGLMFILVAQIFPRYVRRGRFLQRIAHLFRAGS